MLCRFFAACLGFVLLQAPAFAGSQYLGAISMYVCDGGEDLCSNTLESLPVILPDGPFTEDFVFDFVNDFPHYPDDVPLLQGSALLGTNNGDDFWSATVSLYDSHGQSFGYSIFPFSPVQDGYRGVTGGLIYPGDGYYVEVSGFSNIGALPLTVEVSAFDLGPIIAPEPSTWAMMLIGMAGLGFVGLRRSAFATAKRAAS